MPGTLASILRIKLTLLFNMPVFEGQQFTLRENKITVATGIITKLLSPVQATRGQKLKHLPVPQ